MTRKEFLDHLMEYFDVVAELSRKESSALLLLRHKTLQKELVARSTERSLPAADMLKR